MPMKIHTSLFKRSGSLICCLIVPFLLSLHPVSVSGQTSKEYTDAETAAFITDLVAGSYDVYILSTPGGNYQMLSNANVTKEVVIKGKEGLDKKPVLTINNGATGTTNFFFRPQTGCSSITFEGLRLDGTAQGTTALSMFLRGDAGNPNCAVIVRNCEFYNFTSNNGIIRLDAEGSTLDMQNSFVENCTGRMFYFYTAGVDYGDILFKNNTVVHASTASSVLFFRSASGVPARGTSAMVDHCTFYDINGTGDGIFKFRNMSGTVTIRNSIFEQIAGTYAFAGSIIDYCYLAGFETPPDGTNTITTPPQFADVTGNIYALSNFSELTGGDGEILGDLSWYDPAEPKVMPLLEKIDNTHVKLIFEKYVEKTSAEDPANYEIGGTGGLTGQPSEVVLSGSREALLTVGDMSGFDVGQTIVITVSNVTNLLGTPIGVENTASFTFLDVIPPVVTMAGQTADNAAGSFVTAQSNETGKIFLVLEGEPQATLDDLNAAVAALRASVTDVTVPDTDVSISVEGLYAGTYYAYAVDDYNNISEKSANAVVVEDNTPPVVTMAAQTVDNAAGKTVTAQSNETGKIYLILDGVQQANIADFEAAVASSEGASATVTAANAPVLVSVTGLAPGTYYAYATDPSGNISEKSANAATVEEFTPRIRYYDSGQAAQLENDLLAAQNGDVFVLTTSGGIYMFSKYVNITAQVTIMAAEGLEKRPVLKIYRENNTVQTLRLYADGSSITLKGIEFDSDSRDAGSWPVKYAIRTQPSIGRYALTAEDCYFHGTWQANDGSAGSAIKLYENTWADSIIFRNCIFEGDEGVVLNSLAAGPFGWDKFEISNCTFMNMPDDHAIIIRQGGENKTLPVTIDHCTFYNVGGTDQEVIVTDSLYSVILTNSIFASTPADTSWHLFGDAVNQSLADYINFFECPEPLTDEGGILGSNIWDYDPMFLDPENGDLTLGNPVLLDLGSDGLPLGDLRWADIFPPKVKPEMVALSDSTLQLFFTEWVDTTSAETAGNYTIGGTAGFTGNPKKVELLNFYSVMITMDEFTSAVGLVIEITITGVKDLKGNVIAGDNVASYTIVSTKPVVTAETQSATNGPGEKVFVRSNFDSGKVYIILEGVPQSSQSELDEAVAAQKGASASVTAANTNMEISTSGIEPGSYYAYAVSAEGTLSDKGTNAITITDGIKPVVTAERQSAENGENDFVVVRSNEDVGKVYIILSGIPQSSVADFDAAVAELKGASADVTAANTDINVSTHNLLPGVYYAYAVDAAGNISDRGAEPLNISESTVSVDFYGQEDMIRVRSLNRHIVVEFGSEFLTGTVRVSVFDLTGKKIRELTATSTEMSISLDNHQGIFIVMVSQDNKVVTTRKVSMR